MGRRRKRDDEDDFERQWLAKRAASASAASAAAHHVSEDLEDCHQKETTGKNAGSSSSSTNNAANDGDSHNDKSNAATAGPGIAVASPPSVSKVERLRLKKRHRKQRRMEKKAAAAQAAIQREKASQEQQNLVEKARLENKSRQKRLNASTACSAAGDHFKTLRMGVKLLDVIVGKGPVVKDRKRCWVRYILRSKSHFSGKIIDSGSNFSFRHGKGEVIQGWDIGMAGMRVGGTRRLIIPPAAGYGNKDIGAGRGADLFFEIELLRVAL